MSKTSELWVSCEAAIRNQVSDTVWNTIFRDIVAQPLAGSRLVLNVPNTWVKDRIESRYLQIVLDALDSIADEPVELVLEIDITLAPAGLDDPSNLIDLTEHTPPGHTPPGHTPPGHTPPGHPAAPKGLSLAPVISLKSWAHRDHLNPKYTFDSFVTGPSNRFAHAAALSVAERPGRSYNPLFIYGHAGLGKTHLLQAIGNYVKENYSGSTILYGSTETFLNEFVDAIRGSERTDFKRKYREIDVLLMDDVQFLERKEETQVEFFHTFNTLHQANKQIVLSSDRPPDSISTLEDRLRSRFKMGLITDIQPPDLETRIAILRSKVDTEPNRVPPDVMEFIASRITDNIRELEGALTRVVAHSKLHDIPTSIDHARIVLADQIPTQARQVTPEFIIRTTAEMFGFTVEEVIGQRRYRPLVQARQIAMYAFRELTDLSYPSIARHFSDRDHTTVIHAVDKIKNLMATRQQTYDQVTTLLNTIRKHQA